jgi:hypothetical protein
MILLLKTNFKKKYLSIESLIQNQLILYANLKFHF